MAPRLTAVRIRNEGSKPFSQKWAGDRYVVPAGQDHIVPWEAAVLWFGNPDLVDLDRRNRLRTNEYNRLCVKYGVYEKAEQLGPTNFPKVSVWNLTDNSRILMVLDDPTGQTVTPETKTFADNKKLQEQVDLMNSQMEQMRQQMALLTQSPIRDSDGAFVPGDGSTEQAETRPEIKPEPTGVNSPVELDGAEPDLPNTPKVGSKPRRVTAGSTA